MPDEVQDQPEMLETPPVEAESTAPEVPVEEEETPQVDADAQAKELAKKRIDELTWKMREAERQRDRAWEILYEKEKTAPVVPEPQAAAAPITSKPRYEDFESDSDFQEALVEWKAEEVFQRKETERQRREETSRQRSAAEEHNQWMKQGTSKFPDFVSTVVRPMDEVPITGEMAVALKEDPMGHEVAYHLGKNPDEAYRIARLSPTSQIREIGKLAAELKYQKPKPKTQTGAPAPTQPVVGRGAVGKKLEEMSAQEYIDYMNAREFGSARR